MPEQPDEATLDAAQRNTRNVLAVAIPESALMLAWVAVCLTFFPDQQELLVWGLVAIGLVFGVILAVIIISAQKR